MISVINFVLTKTKNNKQTTPKQTNNNREEWVDMKIITIQGISSLINFKSRKQRTGL